jgi:hypothetical protein
MRTTHGHTDRVRYYLRRTSPRPDLLQNPRLVSSPSSPPVFTAASERTQRPSKVPLLISTGGIEAGALEGGFSRSASRIELDHAGGGVAYAVGRPRSMGLGDQPAELVIIPALDAGDLVDRRAGVTKDVIARLNERGADARPQVIVLECARTAKYRAIYDRHLGEGRNLMLFGVCGGAGIVLAIGVGRARKAIRRARLSRSCESFPNYEKHIGYSLSYSYE